MMTTFPTNQSILEEVAITVSIAMVAVMLGLLLLTALYNNHTGMHP